MSTPSTAAEDHDKLYAIINDIRFALLTTVEIDGSLHTRPMANQEADEAGQLWFFAERGAAVHRNTESNPQVSLGYADVHKNTYAAISGTGAIVTDRATIHEKWSEPMKAWFPGGPDDPSIVLLRVTPVRGEFWDSPHSKIVQVAGFIKAKLTGQKADDLVENKKLSL